MDHWKSLRHGQLDARINYSGILTIANLDLHTAIAFGDIFHASHDFRHAGSSSARSIGEGVASERAVRI